MSSYTTAILTCGALDALAGRTVDMVNLLLRQSGLPEFQKANESSTVFVLVGNYLPVVDVVSAVEKIPWGWPERVQLWVRSEHDDKFTEIELELYGIHRDFYYEWEPASDDSTGEYDAFSGTCGTWRMKGRERVYKARSGGH